MPIKMNDPARLTVALVGCGKSKQSRRCKARDMYTSTLFRLASAYAERHHDRWFILSAKWGVLSPDVEIEPYEQRVATSREGRFAWGSLVSVGLIDLHSAGAVFHVHAGADYAQPLAHWREVFTPLAGLQIGQRLAWYKQRLS